MADSVHKALQWGLMYIGGKTHTHTLSTYESHNTHNKQSTHIQSLSTHTKHIKHMITIRHTHT